MNAPAVSGLAARWPVSTVRANRPRRVIVLLLAVLVLSIADYAVTVGHLQSTGMVEANPIAAWIIEHTNSPWLLGMYKVTTVGICIALLHRLRHSIEGEVAAWLALVILIGLSFLWHIYSEEMDSPAQVMSAQAESAERWLFLD